MLGRQDVFPILIENVPYVFGRDLQFLASTSSEATGYSDKILHAHKEHLRRLHVEKQTSDEKQIWWKKSSCIKT